MLVGASLRATIYLAYDYDFQPPARERAYRNNGLFSDHYLDRTLPCRDGWRRLVEESAPTMERLSVAFEEYEPHAGEKGTETKEGWVRSMLRDLRHDAFATQPSLAVPGGTQAPDYVFYWDTSAQDADKGRTLDEERLSGRSYAVDDAKRWDTPLDVAPKRSLEGVEL